MDINQQFKELQSKSQKITEGVIKVNTQIESSEENLKKIQEQAIAKFGTSDLDELKKLLASWESENINQLNEFEKNVLDLEQTYNDTVSLIKKVQNGEV